MATRTRRLSELDGWAIGLGILSLIGVTITNRALPEPLNVAGLSDFPILLASAYFCVRLAGERIARHALTIFSCFVAIFGLYFIGLVLDGSIIAIKNLLGIVIAGSFFFYFERLGRTSTPSYLSVGALLAFALLFLPALYAAWFKVKRDEPAPAPQSTSALGPATGET